MSFVKLPRILKVEPKAGLSRKTCHQILIWWYFRCGRACSAKPTLAQGTCLALARPWLRTVGQPEYPEARWRASVVTVVEVENRTQGDPSLAETGSSIGFRGLGLRV